MRTNELTTGDFVFVDVFGITSVAKISGIIDNEIDADIDGCGDLCLIGLIPEINIRPVPLTADILERSGFEKTGESPHKTEHRLEINDEDDLCLFITLFKRSNSARIEFNPIGSVDARISFSKKECAVHDLQHVMRMCGIEKEVVL